MISRIVSVMLVLASSTAFGIDYGQLMAAKVKAALGDNATKGYKFATYPVDNFGLATAYESKVDINKQICVTWDCLGISDDSKVDAFSAINKLRLVANGTQYANVGAGEGLSLTENEKKALGLKALLPKILQALSLSFDLSQAKNISTDLTTGPVTIRTLRRLEMQKHIQSSNGHQLEKEAFSAGNLVLVYSDIVVSTLKISLKVNAQTDADLEAKLSDALKGKVGKVIGSGSSVGFKVNRATTGEYAFQITRPLIVAVYTKKQPHSQHLGTQGGWKSWTDADMSDANKITLENVDLGEVQ